MDMTDQLNPHYVLELRYEGFKHNKIWCFISFSTLRPRGCYG